MKNKPKRSKNSPNTSMCNDKKVRKFIKEAKKRNNKSRHKSKTKSKNNSKYYYKDK